MIEIRWYGMETGHGVEYADTFGKAYDIADRIDVSEYHNGVTFVVDSIETIYAETNV